MRGFRIASALVAIMATALACNAIVGVEDVRLQSNKIDSGEDPGGDDDSSPPPDPIDSAMPEPEAKTKLALGFSHSCARNQQGTVLCWGSNSSSQLGDALDGGPALAKTPQLVKNVADVLAIGAGVAHTCVATKTDGTVKCWGSNFQGQLGTGSLSPGASSLAVTAIGVSNAVQISAGTSFTCAVIKDGTLSCWGANYSGQLGDGTTDTRPTPAVVAGLAGVTGVSAGDFHTCAIVSGTVRCWGGNDTGQLGNGTTTESHVPPTTGILTDIVQVAAASSFTCARQASGKVFCWGTNQYGELGTGSSNPAPNPSPTLTSVVDAVSIWVGEHHACAARKTGAVACWGDTSRGQTGNNGGTTPDASQPNPAPVIGVSGAIAVSAGGSHSCATDTDGKVYCWGDNSLGQVGNGMSGSGSDALTAVPIGSFP